jgi:hypothetical protein
MNTLKTLIVCALFTAKSFAVFAGYPNAEVPKVEGLGIFKVGKTIEEIVPAVTKEMGEPTPIRSYEDKRDAKFGEIFADTVDKYKSPGYASYCPDSKVYYLAEYVIAEIPVKNIYLKFYKGKLESFTCDMTIKLSDALEAKYGKPSLKKNTTDAHCTASGTSLTLSNVTYYSDWNVESSPVQATAVISEYYTSDCTKRTLYYLSIANSTQSDLSNKCSEAAQKALEARQTEGKKKKLSDL